ncbi:TPA: hypothetical protein N0F65_006884 [Lagenidium giganteum]|uniref:Uncharacterized protein n=1 Tax=Lagenidium giganteum TaxID=4803 RepID=A0AAV2ZDX2_9STRA|nr:TPA: hypothetical protein N0F65_006884 [Lagenidium giganteum]
MRLDHFTRGTDRQWLFEFQIPSVTMTVLEAAGDGSFDASAADALAVAEELREQGNAAFKAKDFEAASKLYTLAIEKDRENQLLYSNRSAAFSQLKQFDRALEDAERAIALARGWAKGYLRKAMACEGLERWQEAIEAHRAIAKLEPESPDAKKALKRVQVLLKRASDESVAVKKGFLGKTTSIFGTSSESETECKWKTMLRRLKEGCSKSGRNARGESVVLDDGVFAKLLVEREFQQLIYPGIPKEQLTHAPKNLQELLEDPWYEEELVALMPKVQDKAQSVLENVKKKGAAQGEFMDPTTEAMLRPQVLQEAFGREVLSMVHRINHKKHVMLANDSRTLADPSSDYATWDQLPDEFLGDLLRQKDSTQGNLPGVAVLDDFMGEEWRPLLWNDVQRMSKNQLLLKMTASVDEQLLNPKKKRADNNNDAVLPRMGGHGRMRFLDHAECQQDYPAIAELLEKLQALPYEINKKRSLQSQLCAQFARCTSIHHLGRGDQQRLRLDCGAGDRDNGFKLSCLYWFNPADADCAATESPGDENSLLQLRISVDEDARVQRIVPTADRLVMWNSRTVLNEITPVKSQELFYLCFWIHGKTLG